MLTLKNRCHNSCLALLPVIAALFLFPVYGSDEEVVYVQNEHTCSHQGKAERLERFLQNNTVPGLNVTYRTVLDAFIDEGHEIYIKGGVIRDLFSSPPRVPHDVDFVFSGSREDIEAIVIKKRWQYTALPEYSIIAIGDEAGPFLEGVPIGGFLPSNKNQLEFTINNIFYHLNSKSFVLNCEEGFADLEHNRLRIQAEDWNDWLYGSLGNARYSKLYRVWKMIGKGYVYQAKLERFLREQVLLAQKNDGAIFNEELFSYMSNHYEAFDDIARGCRAVMGDKWCIDFLMPLREEAARNYDYKRKNSLRFTYFKPYYGEASSDFLTAQPFDYTEND